MHFIKQNIPSTETRLSGYFLLMSDRAEARGRGWKTEGNMHFIKQNIPSTETRLSGYFLLMSDRETV